MLLPPWGLKWRLRLGDAAGGNRIAAGRCSVFLPAGPRFPFRCSTGFDFCPEPVALSTELLRAVHDMSLTSNPDPLDFLNAHIIGSPIIEARGFRVRVPGHALRDLDTPWRGRCDPGRGIPAIAVRPGHTA